MKKVSSLFRTLVCGAMLAGALAGCKPSVQELSLEIPFKCNAYVTPLDSASKVTPAFANNIIANGMATPAQFAAPKGTSEYIEGAPEKWIEYDVAAANALLDGIPTISTREQILQTADATVALIRSRGE